MTAIEDHLTAAMRPARATSEDRWADVAADAHRLRRRDRLVQRTAVGVFIFGLVGTWLLLSRSTDTIDTTPAADAFERNQGRSRFSLDHLVPGLTLLGTLVIAFVVAAWRTRPSGIEQRGWRRGVLTIMIAPILYGPLRLLSLPEDDLTLLMAISWMLKLLSIPVVPLLLWFLAERAAEVRHRWLTLAGVWSVLGVGVVLTARGLISDILRLGIDRLWPVSLGHNDFQERVIPELSNPPGPDWTEERVLAVELAFVVGIAVLSSVLIRLCARGPRAASVVVPLAIFAALAAYHTIAPMGFAFDYDPFWGDLVLGSVYSELIMAFIPLEPFGATAISIASLSMVALLWLWGGPIPAEDPEWWKNTEQDDSDETEDDD